MRLVLIFFISSSFAFSQQNESKLAHQYYINGEYKKAVVIYEQIMESNFSSTYYVPYYTSLLNLEDYKNAIDLSKRLINMYPQQLQYRLGVIIAKEKSGNYSGIERIYDKFFKTLDGSKFQIISVANILMRHGVYNRALDVYLFSESVNLNNDFSLQKAQVYGKLEEEELMIQEYLDAMEVNIANKQIVVSRIQKFLDNDGIKSDKNYQLVKKILLPKVRSEKGRTDFSDMLIWLFMQNHQFDMALRQAKALDKRTNSDGTRVYELGEEFLDNGYFDLAVDAYDYIINKGKNNKFFIESYINKLYALTRVLSYKSQEVSMVNDLYADAISNVGIHSRAVILLSNYAHFKAFYMHDLIAAQRLLDEAMLISGIDHFDLAECKMEYADILLLKGDIWQSMLYYSQVEKDFKEHPIGHEAKLRRAKIYYYQGDFDWAQAQLAILKGSTSKLIANDAMQLSLLITDNYNLDTTDIVMRLFAKADLLLYQKKYDEAVIKYDSILINFYGHSLSDEIYLRKGDIYLENGDVSSALVNYEKIEEQWSFDILSDDALYKRAKVYDDILHNTDAAKQLYEKILLEHSSSVYVAESRKRFRDLRGE